MPGLTPLIEELEFESGRRQVTIPGFGAVEVGPYQILVRVSLTERRLGWIDLPANYPTLPAILDTGSNGTLAIKHDALDKSGIAWTSTSFDPNRPFLIKDANGNEALIPRLEADLWLHSYTPNHRAKWSAGPTPWKKLRIGQRGIAAFVDLDQRVPPPPNGQDGLPKFKYTDRGSAPGCPVPLLGMGALCAQPFHLTTEWGARGGSVTLYF